TSASPSSRRSRRRASGFRSRSATFTLFPALLLPRAVQGRLPRKFRGHRPNPSSRNALKEDCGSRPRLARLSTFHLLRWLSVGSLVEGCSGSAFWHDIHTKRFFVA